MCLFTNKAIKFIADKDFTVIKYLRKNSNSYKTPYQKVPVILNTTMKPSEKKVNIGECGNKYYIDGGVIHSCVYINTNSDNEGNNFVRIKAVVKKGTEFYIQDDFEDIASTELYVTDEILNYDFDNSETLRYLAEKVIKETRINKNGIQIGDVLLEDKSVISILDYINGDTNKKAVGVIQCVKNGYISATALNQTKDKWTQLNNSKLTEYVNSYSQAEQMFDGKKITQEAISNSNYNDDDFPALAYCKNYIDEGIKDGWHLSAPGELKQMVLEMLIINASLIIVNANSLIKIDNWYWASAERNSTGAWGCITYGVSVNGWTNKWGSGYVRPSFALSA